MPSMGGKTSSPLWGVLRHIWVFPSMANHPPKRTILWGKSMVGTPILEYPCIIMYIYNYTYIYIFIYWDIPDIYHYHPLSQCWYIIYIPLYCMVYPHWDNTNAKSLLPSSKVLTVVVTTRMSCATSMWRQCCQHRLMGTISS